MFLKQILLVEFQNLQHAATMPNLKTRLDCFWMITLLTFGTLHSLAHGSSFLHFRGWHQTSRPQFFLLWRGPQSTLPPIRILLTDHLIIKLTINIPYDTNFHNHFIRVVLDRGNDNAIHQTWWVVIIMYSY